MNCDETTQDGIRVSEIDTGKKGKLIKGPAGVVWVKPVNSCWVLFDGESEPRLIPCLNLEAE